MGQDVGGAHLGLNGALPGGPLRAAPLFQERNPRRVGSDMELSTLQRRVDTWIREHGGYWDRFQILARLTEEVGEVAAVLQRQEGLRPRPVETDLEDELGDLLFTLAVLANASNVDLGRAAGRVLDKYQAREAAACKEASAEKDEGGA